MIGIASGMVPIDGLAGGNAGVKVVKTVDATTITPGLALTLAVDRPAAIPGDRLTYSGQVSNTGSSFGTSGRFTAESHASTTSTIAFYFDEVEVCSSVCSSSTPVWTALAGFAAVQPGYTPVETPAVTTGLVLNAAPVVTADVVYPSAGDPILGTQVGPAATGVWTYQAAIALTPAQIATLGDPTQVQGIRNTLHIEVTPRNEQAAQPWTDSVVFANPFQAQPNPAAITGVSVTITAPGGPPLVVDSTSVPALALLKPGDAVPYSVAFPVPVPPAKGAAESDAAYLARLTTLEGGQLPASAAAAGTGPGGPVTAPAPPPVSTTEHLPILGITKSGPPTLDAGTTESNPLALVNSGGAPASALAVSDRLPGGTTGTVSGLPASLAAAATASASAGFPVPADQPQGSLTDTAALTWQDANGNAYGPVSSSFTTTVHNPLLGARLTLAPAAAGPDIVGSSQALTATLVDSAGAPIAGQSVAFAVAGANPASGSTVTDATGSAAFGYVGVNPGTDQVQATVHAASITLQSNTSSVGWIKPIQTISSTTVQGSFFHESTGTTSFVARPGDVPDFGQTFPSIAFDPLPGTVPHDISGVSNQTRPFTDLTTDANGNFNGTIVAQGSGVQAGVGAMSAFDAVFTGTYVVSEAGDVTLNLTVGDGFVLGVGGGASRVSGDLIDPPASGTSAFQGYPVIAAFQQQSGAATRTATIHFPAPGTYPYEIDYFECCGGDLSLVVTAASVIPQTSPLSIYVGYADGLRPAGSVFPFPWLGSPGVTFIGDTTHQFDSGALRFDNSSDAAITLDSVTVDVGSNHFDLWPHGLTVPAQQTLILAQTNNQNFDTSDFPIQCGANNGVIPVVNVTIAGIPTSFKDTHQVLNTGGIDPGICPRNESESWQRIAGTASPIDVPLPPAVSLNLSPFTVPGATVGLAQKLTVTAMDGSGLPVANQPLTVQVFGPNAQQLAATTDAGGVATFSYAGAAAGTDQVQASGFVTGFRAVSNIASVTWTAPPPPNPGVPPGPAPSIANLAPADGAIVTKPVAVTASIAPPAGQGIVSWQVTYQAQDPGPVVTIASGTGTPPATLATFDPTLLPNDTYAITVSAVATDGIGLQLTTMVAVLGNLKLGRYRTTYQDLDVPVNGFRMQVRRTYDSFDKGQGDFGIGWRVEVVNFRTAANRQLGAGGWSMYDTSCFVGVCTTAFKSSAPHFVSVTFPDQHTEVFDFTPQGGTNVFWSATAAFTARPGTGTASTLEVVGGSSLTYLGDGNLYSGSLPFDPQRFRLTTLDGRVLILDRTAGLVSETDRNGNSVTIDGAGIHASNGQSIAYTRDASGRITQVTGPSGQTLGYAYSAAGDLAGSTDPNGNQTTYSYDGNHDLLQAAGGSQPLVSFQYDTSGRLTSVTDALGNTTHVSSNAAGQQTTVTDPLGRLTSIYTMDDLGDVVREDDTFDGRTLTRTATYDPAGRPLTRTDFAGGVWTGSYDPAGNLLSVRGPAGSSLSLTYDAHGAPLTLTDTLGNATRFAYDAGGNLTTRTDALGGVDAYTYDAAGHQVTHTDPLGRTWNFAYDAQGHLTSSTDALGGSAHLAYDGSGRVTGFTDAKGATTVYKYDATGNLLTITDALGHTSSQAFNAQNLLSSAVDALGHTTAYAYDAGHRWSSTTDPLGNTTSAAYDADGHIVSVTDAAGGTTSGVYDGGGRLVALMDAVGRTTHYGYDANGRPTTETAPNGGITTFGYDAEGRETSTVDPLGGTTSSTYDARGQLVAVTDPLGRITAYTRDALGRAIEVTDPAGGSSSSIYDAAGQLVATADQTGARTTYAYDAAGRQVAMTDPLGHTTSDAYDSDGRPVAETDPLGRVARTTYDADGRAVSATTPSGITTTFAYDAAGRLVSSADALGDITTYAYDAAGRLIQVTDSMGAVTTYGYDAVGRRTSLTDAVGGVVTTSYDAAGQETSLANPRGDTTTYAYDALGNVASTTDPASGTTIDAYDLAGRLASSTDARGVTLGYTYDAASQLLRTTYPGGGIVYAYDARGERTSMSDATGVTSYGYDSTGRPTSVASPQGTVAYTYDAAGNRTGMTLPGARAVAYHYDAANELVAIDDWNGQHFGSTYDADGQQASLTRPNGVTTTYGYDGAGRLVAVGNDGAAAPLADFAYTLDRNGNRTGVTGPNGKETYTLDALGRITQASYGNGDLETFGYDAAGNRTSYSLNGSTTPYTYDSTGRLASAGGVTFGYDAAGDLTSAGPSTYSWDPLGNLASSTVGGAQSTYTYDGGGLRVGQQAGGATSTYLWDRAADVPTLVGDGQSTYLTTDALQAGVLEQSPNGAGAAATAYPLADALGSVQAMTDAAGSVAGRSSYSVFGQLRSTSGSRSVLGFAGEPTDPTGLLYLQARYLDPTLGRFLSPDSALPNGPGTQGFNLYGYAGQNPTTTTDPSGRGSETETVEIEAAEAPAEEVLATKVVPLWVEALQAALVGWLLGTEIGRTICGLDPGFCAQAYAAVHGSATATTTRPVAPPVTATQPQPSQQPQPQPVTAVTTVPRRCTVDPFTAVLQAQSLKVRADTINAVRPPRYRSQQAVADLEVRLPDQTCQYLFAGGQAKDLTPAQRALLIPPLEVWSHDVKRLPWPDHAEVRDLYAAYVGEQAVALIMGVSRPVCTPGGLRSSLCRPWIAATLGMIIPPDDQTVVWWGNLA